MKRKNWTIIIGILAIFLGIIFFARISLQPVAAQGNPSPTQNPPEATPVPEKYRWDLEKIYPNPDAWEKDFKAIQDTSVSEYDKYVGKLGEKANLLKLFETDEKTQRTMDKLYVYAWMKSDDNQEDSKESERASRADSLLTKLGSARAFISPELVNLPDNTIKSYLADKDFEKYKHLLEATLKQKEHTLPKEQEELLAATGEMGAAPGKISSKIREADMQFPKIKNSKGEEVELSEAVYGLVLSDPDRDFRKRSFEGILGAYDKYKFGLAATLDTQVRSDWFYAKTSKYKSSAEASLGANFIPTDVYDNLIKATDKNLKILHQYVALRKQVLGVDKIHGYDMFNPLIESYTVEVPFDDTQQLLDKALAPLGKDYTDQLDKGLNSRWVDVYERKGKTSGGYSWGSYDTQPYILMNYTSDFSDGVMTLAHEMGHSLNSYYTNKNQSYIYSNTPIFTAEIASTTNEMLVLQYMQKNAKNDAEKLYFLNQLAENIRGTFFVQVMFADFEKQIHARVENGDALSVDSLNQIWGEIMTKYYGPDYEVDDLAKIGWARIPHFYRNFYVYQYATGIAASNQFVKNITEDKPGAKEKYLTFLSAGSVDYPINVLKEAGVDMLSPAPVDNLISDFGKIVNQMEELLKKQGKIK